jgi:hypothetical protein
MLRDGIFFLFVLIFMIELLNPALDAAKVEGLATLVARPYGTSVENRVVTNDALLIPFGKGLNQVDALFGQPSELVQKVLEVIVDCGSLLGSLSCPVFLLIDKLHLFFPDLGA